jgi:hypothetical protein
LESFQQAYRLAPHPSVRVNMANCYVELRRPVEAIFHFEQYLAETPDAETPQRTAVQNHLRELRQRVTEVTISVSPTNAAGVTATVDGLAVALDRTVRLAPGRHTLEVLAEGYFPARQDFDGPRRGAATPYHRAPSQRRHRGHGIAPRDTATRAERPDRDAPAHGRRDAPGDASDGPGIDRCGPSRAAPRARPGRGRDGLEHGALEPARAQADAGAGAVLDRRGGDRRGRGRDGGVWQPRALGQRRV